MTTLHDIGFLREKMVILRERQKELKVLAEKNDFEAYRELSLVNHRIEVLKNRISGDFARGETIFFEKIK